MQSVSLHDVDVYDPVTDAWSKGEQWSDARLASCIGEWNGRIYCIGGSCGGSDFIKTMLTTTSIYNASEDKWERGAETARNCAHQLATLHLWG